MFSSLVATYKVEGPNSDLSTHSNKPCMVSGAAVSLNLWKDEAGGSLGLAGCQPCHKGGFQVQGETLSQVNRQKVMEDSDVLFYPEPGHTRMYTTLT